MTHLIIDNSGRSGVTANMIVTEFMATVYHPGTDKDLACYRILVSNLKRAEQYGSAVIWAYDDLHKMVNIYQELYKASSWQLPHRLSSYSF